jgi:thioredoxin 1
MHLITCTQNAGDRSKGAGAAGVLDWQRRGAVSRGAVIVLAAGLLATGAVLYKSVRPGSAADASHSTQTHGAQPVPATTAQGTPPAARQPAPTATPTHALAAMAQHTSAATAQRAPVATPQPAPAARPQRPPAATPKTVPPPATAPALNLPRLIDFGADRCRVCQRLAPVLDELRKEYAGRVSIEFIDVWKKHGAGRPYKVRMVPTCILFDRDGKEVWRHEGFLSKAGFIADFAELGVK